MSESSRGRSADSTWKLRVHELCDAADFKLAQHGPRVRVVESFKLEARAPLARIAKDGDFRGRAGNGPIGWLDEIGARGIGDEEGVGGVEGGFLRGDDNAWIRDGTEEFDGGGLAFVRGSSRGR